MYNSLLFQYKINFYFVKSQLRSRNCFYPIYILPAIYILSVYEINLIPMLIIILNKTFTKPLSFYNFPQQFIDFYSFVNNKIIRIAGFYSLFLYNIFLVTGFYFFRNENSTKFFFEAEIILIVSLLVGNKIHELSKLITVKKTLVTFIDTFFIGIIIYITLNLWEIFFF